MVGNFIIQHLLIGEMCGVWNSFWKLDFNVVELSSTQTQQESQGEGSGPECFTLSAWRKVHPIINCFGFRLVIQGVALSTVLASTISLVWNEWWFIRLFFESVVPWTHGSCVHHAYLASLLVGLWPGIHRIHVIYVCMMTIPVRLHQTVPGLLAGTLEMVNGQQISQKYLQTVVDNVFKHWYLLLHYYKSWYICQWQLTWMPCFTKPAATTHIRHICAPMLKGISSK